MSLALCHREIALERLILPEIMSSIQDRLLSMKSHRQLSDLVNATGNITIDPGATFALMPDMGIYTAGTIYEVMQSTGGAVTGTFSNFTNTNPMVMGHLVYTPSGVFFEVGQSTSLVNLCRNRKCRKSRSSDRSSYRFRKYKSESTHHDASSIKPAAACQRA